jgi:hypothetical protein
MVLVEERSATLRPPTIAGRAARVGATRGAGAPQLIPAVASRRDAPSYSAGW